MYLDKDKIKEVIRQPAFILTLGITVCLAGIIGGTYIKSNNEKNKTPIGIDDTNNILEECGTILSLIEKSSEADEYTHYKVEYLNQEQGIVVKKESVQLDGTWKTEIYKEHPDIQNTGFINDTIGIDDLINIPKGNYLYLKDYTTDIESVYSLNKDDYLKYIKQLIGNGEEIIRLVQTTSYIDIYTYDKITEKTKRLLNIDSESIISEVNKNKLPEIDSYFNIE